MSQTFQVVFEQMECGECGLIFFVPAAFRLDRQRDHRTWHCPNGHPRCYSDESDVAKAQRLQAESERRAQARINEANHARLVAERDRDNAIKAKRKIERRISKGVCPCCNRSFDDLHRHMSTKHKDYALPPGKNPKLITAVVQ